MAFLIDYAEQTWAMIAEMGAYLLLGFGISALLHRYLKQAWVERLMGKKGIASILWGSVVGVPMPLCSCGVIPVTMSLRDKGASKGATVSFLTSTPQTGIDSILATYAMLGPVFTAYKVIVAFLSGITVGLLTNLLEPKSKPQKTQFHIPNSKFLIPNSTTPLRPTNPTPRTQHPTPTFSQSLRYGFQTMPGDLSKSLLFGFLLAGLIATFAPANILANIPGGAISAILVTTLISVPFYICSTGSIPLALALIHSGLPVAAALVLLIAGPATNITTITTMRKVLGGRTTIIYVAGVVLSAWLAAAIYHLVLDNGTIAQQATHLHDQLPLWKHLGGIALILVLILPHLRTRIQNPTPRTQLPDMQTATISIHGMTCSHCESSARAGLADLPFTANVISVDRKTNTAVIQGENIDEAQIRKKIEALGFDYKSTKIS